MAFAACTAAVVSGNYVLPERNLVVIEADANGAQLEKRVAEQADLLFSREMKTAALLGPSGVTGYRATVTLNLRNVSGRQLAGVSLIETIPKEIAGSTASVQSDSNFLVLESDPLIKFQAGTMGAGDTVRVSYSVALGAENPEALEAVFRGMSVPLALIPISGTDCTGVMCNDFNPCTVDYCHDRQCVFDNAPDGLQCGAGMVCVKGRCQSFKNPDLIVLAGVVIIVVVLLSVLASVLMARGKRKK
ncbi:MAG: hypothetical protein NTW59_02115 [Candidatus Diapherotrites archaeon]|nr:hypothetical protein [Candidatus Diapherotrites archaeon]